MSTTSFRRKRLKYLREEYRAYKRRSDAAKRGWITRRLRERGVPEPPKEQITITRLSYKPKHGRIVHIEVTRRGNRIIDIRVGKRSYSTASDIAMLGNLLENATPDDDGSS